MTLAEKLFFLRTEKGLSQEDLAAELEVSRQSVSKWETGQSVPDLDKLIKLADLFGVSVDELVREGERPRPPEPEVRTVYVEREKKGLTPVQKLGIVFEAVGGVLAVVGLLGAGFLILVGAVLVVLGLPLLLARKHPLLIAGWLAVLLSLLVLNPNTSVSPWGLAGGLCYLQLMLLNPKMRYRTYFIAAAVGIIRGLLTLVLLFFTGRLWWRKWKAKPSPSKGEGGTAEGRDG